MDNLMQTLFYYIEDNLLEAYGTQTDLSNQYSLRAKAEQRLRDTLNEEQTALLEDLLKASFYTETATLEAMFLAAYDLSRSLLRSHA